ncbi:hypothetical protein BH24ACT1_BH24ACT1_01250 [soil metagenome]
MEPGLLRDGLTLVVGLITGVLSGAFGVGGAIISTPGIRLLGVGPLVALGTTLPAILPSALSGGLRYQAEELIDWRAVTLTVPSGLVASVGGALLSGLVPGEGHLLQIMTAALLGFSAWRTLVERRSPASPGEDRPPGSGRGRSARLAGVGLAAGGLSGLLGLGGGLILVPGLNQLGDLSLRSSVATSLVCAGAFAVPGAITHGLLGNIDWRVALLLALTVVPGARLGAAASLRLGDRGLATAVAVFLGVVAIVYAGGELSALAAD